MADRSAIISKTELELADDPTLHTIWYLIVAAFTIKSTIVGDVV